MSKGHARRQRYISGKLFSENWDRVFGKTQPIPEGVKDTLPEICVRAREESLVGRTPKDTTGRASDD